ncbi:MAG: HK97 family phage prohead protease [Actinomycetota bacterium]|nr:HK97 family phage prohead protease [Actinomycetota bacterium]
MTAAQALKTPPRVDVCRSVPFTLTRDGEADGGGDGLTFEGYGAVFNSPTRIDSWEGTFDEQIAPGAFRKSLKERTPKFQFDHGRSVLGTLPCGVIGDIHEDDQGLYVSARMAASWYWEPLREAISSGAVDGMSFRFSVVRDEWVDAAGKVIKTDAELHSLLWGEEPERLPLLRTLKEVKVAEVGPVVWPAYEGTSASLRSKAIDLEALQKGDPEQRKLFAAAALAIRVADEDAPDRGESDDEPQDTPHGAVEHSGEDDDTPQPTDQAGEHESNPTEPAPTDDVDAALAAAEERLFTEALATVRSARESTPPMKGLSK